ncbi:MAG TPA: hypothetical protein VFF63_04465 [Candidatus Babeliales bacterium]|nr:hypothetical protein [Candidatus Babeliales bacterium]
MRRLLAAFAVLLVASCGSGGGQPNGPVVNSPGSGPTQPPTQLVGVKVTVTVPATKKASRFRRDYISVNTQSLVIELSSVNGEGVTGVNPTTINTVAGARGCTQQQTGLVCSATASGSPGQDVFSVTTYAGTNSTGPVLSVGTVSAEIHSGSGIFISNTLSLALDGVIAGVKLELSPDKAKRGKAVNAAVALSAFDATGAQIVGPSDFEAPIALEIQGDTGNAFTLQAGKQLGQSLSIVKPTSNITLRYDGNRNASSVTLQATVDGPGSIGASDDFTLRGKQKSPPPGTIYALNLGSKSGEGATVTEYAGTASGNTAPERTLQLSSKLYARSIAVDADNNLYVGYLDNSLGYDPATGKPDTGNEIAIYASGASGNAPPTAVITSDSSTQTALFPLFTSFDPSGDLVTYGATAIDSIGGDDAVLTYASGASGPAVPAQAWAFAPPVLYYAGPTGLALDSAGNFYVNGALHSELGPTYGLFAVPASDNGNDSVYPSRTIPWNATTELTPGQTTNVVLDSAGEIFIANTVVSGSGSSLSCQARANVYSAGDGGGSTPQSPLRVLTFNGVSSTGYQCVSSRNALQPFFPTIALYGTTLFAADDFANAIDEFPANGSGTLKPSVSIAGSSTQLDAPIALAITSVSGEAKAQPARPLDAL